MAGDSTCSPRSGPCGSCEEIGFLNFSFGCVGFGKFAFSREHCGAVGALASRAWLRGSFAVSLGELERQGLVFGRNAVSLFSVAGPVSMCASCACVAEVDLKGG